MKKIFFSASTYAVPELLGNYLKIIKEIEKNDAKIILNWTKDWRAIAKQYKNKNKKEVKESDVLRIIDRKKFYAEHTQAIKKSNAVIAEVTKPTISVGYQLFYAVMHKKPVLALYEQGNEVDLKTIKSIINSESPLVLLKKYNKSSLPITIKNFIKKRNAQLKKFNFIISDEIEQYINWLKTKEPEKSRSELLREVILNEIIINDEDYQRHLNTL